MKSQSVLTYLTAVGLLLSMVSGTAVFASTEGDRPPATLEDRTLDPSGISLENAAPSSASIAQTSWSGDLTQWAIAVVDQTVPQTTTATLFTADASCSGFEATTVELPKEGAIAQAVGAVLADESIDGIPLTGYRVDQRLSGAVRVDLRFAPGMSQSIYSLSSCEQFALFDSIRATLIHNSQWQVTQVIFTERGKELAL